MGPAGGRDVATHRFRVSTQLARRLEQEGLRLPDVVQRASLPAGFFAQDKIFVSTGELFALWRAIAGASGDPAIGLRLGSEACVEHHDPAAIAALCSQSFGDAVQRMARYKQLTCPEEIRTDVSREEVAVEFAWLLAEEDEPPVLVDLCLAWILGIGRRGTGQPLQPLRVELARPPAQREVLEAHYGCRVHFRAARNALVFRKGDLERPFVTYNADLLAMLGPQLDKELRLRRDGESLGGRVKATVKRLLAGRRPALSDVARQLGMSARTLQRRLGESGATFQSVVEEARREMARHYLGQTSLELVETAYLLGFEDSNSFFRAFHHWEGTSPGEWRNARRSKGAGAAGVA
jgi:AraC-like DNA-binding protein